MTRLAITWTGIVNTMTDMDWADKIAWHFVSEFDDCTTSDETFDTATALSAALRKAKADGMREAAGIAYEYLLEQGKDILAVELHVILTPDDPPST